MNILVIAGLSNHKLASKLESIWDNPKVNKLYLVRREPLGNKHPKVINCCPPKWLRKNIPLSEIWRFATLLILVPTKHIKLIIGIHYYMHCVYAALAGLIYRVNYLILLSENPLLYEHKKWFWTFSRQASYVGVRGENSKSYLMKHGIAEENIFIPPNIFDFSVVEPDPSDKYYDMIFVGALVPDKRVDILLKAVAYLKEKKPDIRILLVGDGRLRKELLKLKDELSLNETIDFKGHQQDIFNYLKMAKLLILTSRTEGMPMVVVEAMACGLPCIVPDVGDIRDVAIHEYNSLVVEPLNANAFADAAYRLLTDEVFYTNLAENALKIREDKKYEYSHENLNNIWSVILNKV